MPTPEGVERTELIRSSRDAYRVELYPHYDQLSGIRDARGHALTFPSAFRTVRLTDEEKGIVRLLPD